MNKIPNRYRMMVFAVIMSLCTAMTVSGVITWIHVDQWKEFLSQWQAAFLLAWPIVFLCILITGPAINRLVNTIVEQG